MDYGLRPGLSRRLSVLDTGVVSCVLFLSMLLSVQIVCSGELRTCANGDCRGFLNYYILLLPLLPAVRGLRLTSAIKD